MKVSKKQWMFDHIWYARAATYATICIATTNAVKNDLIRFFKIYPRKIHIVMPSVDIIYNQSLQNSDIQSVLKTYKIKKPYLVYIGNRREHKNINGAIEIFSNIAEKHSDLSLVLIGGFDTEKKQSDERFATQIREKYPIAYKRIKILGKIQSNEPVHAILAGSVALLFPTRFEGFGITPLEAMYSKTAVVSSAIPPIKEVVKSTGILIDPDDTEKFSEAIETLLTNDDYRRTMIGKGYARAQEISWDEAARKLHHALFLGMKKR